MTTLSPFAPLCRTFNQSVCSRILLRLLSTHTLQPHNFNKRKLLKLSAIRVNAKGSYSTEKLLTLENINQGVVAIEYAVCGPLVIRAAQLQEELLQKKISKPFKDVIRANVGDCHAMGQKPITFIRQVLSLVSNPSLFDLATFPEDVKSRARLMLDNCYGSSIGSYSHTAGIELIRKHVAQYIERRDGIPSNFEDIILRAGASSGIRAVLNLINSEINGKKPGVMIPIPQFPLYSATVTEFKMAPIHYYLDESRNWSLTVSELERAINEARKKCHPRILVIINPGNPTGQVLSRENIEEVIKFAYREKLFIFADEVYQDNVYAEGCKFHSFKKVLTEMGPPYSDMELASFMSCSKGYVGECGLRGAYAEIINIDPQIRAMLLKLLTAMLCPTVHGQVTLDCVVNPPMPGDESYELFAQEKKAILSSLAERAKMVAERLNNLPGYTCNPVQGAMYAFPRLHLPEKAIKMAESLNMCPSLFYAFELLEKAGVCVVPGAGFGQVPGTYHFRTTILPQPPRLKELLDRLEKFHLHFLEEFK